MPIVGQGENLTCYNSSGLQIVVMRVEEGPDSWKNGVFYLLDGHLGSSAITVDSDGDDGGELRYKA